MFPLIVVQLDGVMNRSRRFFLSDTFFGDVDFGVDDAVLSPSAAPEVEPDVPGQALDSSVDGYDYFNDPAFMDFLQSYMEYNSIDSGVDLASLDPSASSYLSTAQLDLFDRILKSGDYRYYIGYRTGSDSYGAVLYACDKITVSGSTIVMDSPMRFQLYRTYSGNQYYYYYTHTQLSADTVNLNSSILYYTNMVAGYPTLGDVGRNELMLSQPAIIAFGVFVLLLMLILLRRRH